MRFTREDIAKLPQRMQDQIYAQLNNGKKTNNRDATCGSVKERSRETAPHETIQIPQFDSPVRITVHVWKCGGNWDADNIETKCIVDSLVKSGVIKDDSIKEAPEILRIGTRVKTRIEERTVIIIEEIKQ